ncbi:MAG: cold shock domain-containing protein [Bacteroidota bacterium]
MADTYNKKEREKKRELKKKDKASKKEQRKDDAPGGGWESMMAYVDEDGMIRDTPPDPMAKKSVVNADNIEIGVPKREKEEVDFVLRGTISYFDDTKGYGFIKTADEENFFVHQNNISGDPQKGKKVRFEKEKGAKGWAAIKVVIE